MANEHFNYDTVIIGAGFAGIAAARTFEEEKSAGKKGTDYVVLEADSKIGGRAQSEIIEVSGGKKIILNPGAQWLHSDLRDGALENPLLSFARECDTLVHDDMPRDFFQQGTRTRYLSAIDRIKRARTVIDKYGEDQDTDLKSLFKDKGLGTSNALVTTFGEVETGAPLHRVSTHDVRELVACNKGDFTSKGVGNLVAHYAKDILPHVKLNTQVTKIQWQNEGEHRVAIHTKNGDVYYAKNAVITVSVGVLKSGAITFEPPLPEEYCENLNHIEMGNFNKIFIIFDQNFRFPVSKNTHLDVRTKSGQDIFYLAKDNGQPVVTTFLGGNHAKMCDEKPEDAKKMALDGLAEIWGDEIRKHVIDTKATEWGNNPLVKGGYSRVDIGHHNVREALAKPIENSLYLAGEAVGAVHPESGRNWATHMAGAAISGERAARAILQLEHSRTAVGKYVHRGDTPPNDIAVR
jgi:monoamine oxidase